jgi:hypothetical protein
LFEELVPFAQTDLTTGARLPAFTLGSDLMAATSKNVLHKDYVRYARHSLEMVTAAKDQDARTIQREMAVEWLRLADELLHRQKPPK